MQEGKRLRTTILALAWTALTAVFALGTPATAAAQGTATIRGTVTDASGGVLPGATVTITNSGTKDIRPAISPSVPEAKRCSRRNGSPKPATAGTTW